MTDGFVDRLRDLPPQLPDISDRLDRVYRLVSRRRHRQVGLVGVATVLAIVVPVAVVSGLPGNPGRAPVQPQVPAPSAVAEVSRACPGSGLTITDLPVAERMTHSPAQARSAFSRHGPSGHIIDVFPAVVTDPIAAKLGLGSATTPRRMWVIYRITTLLSSSRNGESGSAAPAGLPGTRLAQISLLDDATLGPGGTFTCKPVSATARNVGYGIANGSRVGATGLISPAGDGEVLCFFGGVAFTDTIPGVGPRCVDQVALSGDASQLSRWSGKTRYVTGTWQASGLLVTSTGPARQDDSDPFGHGPPCPTPPGGWAHVAPSSTPNLDSTAFQHYKTANPGIVVTVAAFRPSNLTPVLTIASTNPAATRSALAAAYPRALCVVASHFTLSQVHQARREVQQAFTAGDLPGVYGYGSDPNADAQPTIELDALSDRPELHNNLANLTPGLLVIQPWLHTLAAPAT
jgi:hypothetical protein